MFAMMAVNVNRAFKISHRLRQFFAALLGNAIVRMRQVNVFQTMFFGKIQIRLSAIHADDCLDPEVL